MGLLSQVLTGVIASRMGGRMGGGLGGALGGAVLGGAMRRGGRGSPVMKALLLLLAAKAARDYMGRRGAGAGAGGPSAGGLGALIEQFNRTGHGDVINSWIGRGPNRTLPPQQLADALGADTIDALQQETGMEREEMLQELADTLPEAVDQLSPEGAAPDPQVLEGDEEDLSLARPPT
jgi:uncharacterized protein YidB (DUF937 family)